MAASPVFRDVPVLPDPRVIPADTLPIDSPTVPKAHTIRPEFASVREVVRILAPDPA